MLPLSASERGPGGEVVFGRRPFTSPPLRSGEGGPEQRREDFHAPPEYHHLAVEFEPEGNPRVPFEAGQLLERAGNLAGAATLYDRAFGLAPEDAEIRTAFAALLDKLRRTDHGLVWRYVPGGVFLMGHHFSEPDERPWHPVWLKPYWVTDTCVSRADYFRLMGWDEETRRFGPTLPPEPAFDFLRVNEHLLDRVNRVGDQYSTGAEDHGDNDDWSGRADLKPYVAVSHQMAALLAHKLTTDSTVGSYRLPTEAQWEKAARGGLIGAPFPWGWEPAMPDRIDCGRFYDFGIKPMRSLPPNAYGLFSMCGGVWEWTGDFYDRDYYRNGPHEDPPGPATGEERVLRGGSWADCPEVCTVSFRASMGAGPDARDHITPTVGFRLARAEG